MSSTINKKIEMLFYKRNNCTINYSVTSSFYFNSIIFQPMSYSKSNNIKAIVKYCKVCHDAGKSESEYRSHFIRESPSPTSRVVCPTLLALECRYCFNSGHTIKYCPTLKKHEKEELGNAYLTQTNSKATFNLHKPKSNVSSKSNLFECLNHDSSDEEDEPQEVKPKAQDADIKQGMSYATILSTKQATNAPPVITNVHPKIAVVQIPYKMSSISWADVSDSEPDDDEDDDEEEFYTCISSNR
jgi:hypothetical protein